MYQYINHAVCINIEDSYYRLKEYTILYVFRAPGHDLLVLLSQYEQREIVEIKQINRGSNSVDAIIKLRSYQVLKDLINTNTVKLQVTEWVERIGDKESSISDLVNWDIGRTSGTLPLCNCNLLLHDGNLPLSATLYQYRNNQGRKRQEAYLVKS